MRHESCGAVWCGHQEGRIAGIPTFLLPLEIQLLGRIVEERNGIPRLGFINRRSRLDEPVGWERCAIVGQLVVVYSGCDQKPRRMDAVLLLESLLVVLVVEVGGVRQHELATHTCEVAKFHCPPRGRRE